IPGSLASEWRQSLVLLFSPRGTRRPVLFFKSKEALINLVSNAGIEAGLERLAEDFAVLKDTGESAPADFPLTAMEPDDEEGSVPYDHFYLMPIFSSDEQYDSFKILEVGSIDPNLEPEGGEGGGGGSGSSGAGGGESPPLDRPTSAIAFVIDTTISMGPYIEECRNLVRDIYDRIEQSGQGRNVALGVVAFRSSVEARPDTEYNTRIISPLRTALDRQSMEDALAQVEEARASTHAYAEDSLAGINAAIEKLNWNPYRGRIIFLLTDAGPLPEGDEFSSIPATPDTIYDKARAQDIKIIPVHIKDPKGTRDHSSAERAYRSLAFEENGQSLYFDISVPNSAAGAENFLIASEGIIENIEQSLFTPGQMSPTREEDRDVPPESRPLRDRAAELGRILGHSIRLEYLGAKNKASSPRVVRSWISDKDLGALDRPSPRHIWSVDVAVLLTKNQLSSLARQLKLVVDTAERDLATQSGDFFKSILAASAQISRDPAQFSLKPETRLGELGLMTEFLEDLPYKSLIMGMTESDWYNMSPGEQDSMVRGIRARLDAYSGYDRDVDHWAKFDERNDGEWLYRVPLKMLP
ncbi:MAG: VWA domain-containing protein, partial [Deltaproteobacteria bacterium]|nr:VWA domain-containing protein [Deltaproteobacteria bacterium]